MTAIAYLQGLIDAIESGTSIPVQLSELRLLMELIKKEVK